MPEISEELRGTVRDTREARGLSQVDLAELAGVSENTVVSLETGGRNTQPRKLRRILEALGVSHPGEPGAGGVPPDVAEFLRVAGERLSALGDADRARALSHLYPRLLAETPVEQLAARLAAEARERVRVEAERRTR